MVGSNREATIEFYKGFLGMPLVFSQPNHDVPVEEHLYFDIGDGRVLTFFVRPNRGNDPIRNSEDIGTVHHLAFTVSRAVFSQVAEHLDARGIENTGSLDRGKVDAIYYRDPNGLLLELNYFKFMPPRGFTIIDVVRTAHSIRVTARDDHIEERHITRAIAELERHKPHE